MFSNAMKLITFSWLHFFTLLAFILKRDPKCQNLTLILNLKNI